MSKNKIEKNIPLRDWKIVITIFAVFWAIISALAWQVYLSDKMGGGYFKLDLPVAEEKTRVIDEKRLQRDILLLEKVAAPTLKVIDPSL